MTEHFCIEHQTKWFKTEKMKGYAHPIKDADEKTIGWCNEPKETEKPVEKLTKPEPSQPPTKYKTDPIKTESIETQVAIKALVELRVGGVLTDKSPEYQAMLTWCRGRLGVELKPIQDAPQSISSPVEQGNHDVARTNKESRDIDGLIKSLKVIRWTESTAKSWLRSQYHVDVTPLLKDVCAILTTEQWTGFIGHVHSLEELK